MAHPTGPRTIRFPGKFPSVVFSGVPNFPKPWEAPLSCLIVIPARYASTRLPGKPLRLLRGRPLVLHALDAARRAELGRVIVATDDERIASVVAAAGGEARMTSEAHRTGTDRVAEVARECPGEVVLDLQGDEPDADPALMRRLCAAVEAGDEMVTAAARVADPLEAALPQVVKVVCDAGGRALYFSRAVIPARHPGAGGPAPAVLGHMGIYAFRRETLLRFVALPPGALEQAEGLEQLRALENGIPIRVLLTGTRTRGVDTEDDLRNLEST